MREKAIKICDRCIVFCLCLLIFCLPFAKAAIGAFTILVFLLLILKRIIGYRTAGLWGVIPATELNKLIGIYIIVNAISVLLSVDYGLSLKAFFTKELKFIVIFFMVTETVVTKNRIRSILISIFASSVLLIADASVQQVRGTDFLKGFPWMGLTASFSNPNGFAGWLIIVIPLCASLVFASNSIKRKSKVLKIVNISFKIILSIVTVLLIICLVLTFSRAALWSFVVGFLFFICCGIIKVIQENKTPILIISLFLLIILIIILFSQREKIMEIGNISIRDNVALLDLFKRKSDINIQDSDFYRFNLLKESFSIIKDYPLFGCGLNTYSRVVKHYRNFGDTGTYTYPHNSFLQKTAETGLAGLFAFLLLIFSLFMAGIRHIFLYTNRNNALLIGLLGGILAFLVQSFFDNNLYALQLVVLFWFMMGLTMAVINLERHSSAEQPYPNFLYKG